jgi:Sulfotransferase domain
LKQLYIHAGFPKTGTTTVQHFLYANRKKLKQQGVLYPKSCNHDHAHHPLVLSCINNKIETLSQIPTFPVSEIIETLGKEIISSNCEKVVLSSEFFILFFHACNSGGIEKLVDFFNNFHCSTILYLRHPLSFIESGYSQEMKNTRMKVPVAFEDFKTSFLKRSGLKYENVIDFFSDHLGNVIVRPFDRNQLKDKDILSDFMSIVGFQNIESFKKESMYSNRHLSKQRIAIMNEISKFNISQGLREYLFHCFDAIPLTEYEVKQKETLLTPEVREKLYNDFLPRDKMLAKYSSDSASKVFFKKEELMKPMPLFEKVSDTFLDEFTAKLHKKIRYNLKYRYMFYIFLKQASAENSLLRRIRERI